MTQNNVFLIDAGPETPAMRRCLERHLPFWRRTLTGLILTHPDQDHVGGIKSILEVYKLTYLFSNFTAEKNTDFSEILDLVRYKKVIEKTFLAGEEIRVGEKVKIKFWWPLNTHSESDDTNLFSTVNSVETEKSKYLFLADAEIATQIELLPELAKQKFQVIKLSHHGSAKNFSYTLIKTLAPKEVVISVGKNSFGHPSQTVLDLLAQEKVKVIRTDEDGDWGE